MQKNAHKTKFKIILRITKYQKCVNLRDFLGRREALIMDKINLEYYTSNMQVMYK